MDGWGLCVIVLLGYFKENILLHFIASMISGLITTAASMPVDIAKTRFDVLHLVVSEWAEYYVQLDTL